jgi:hypothetical protein
MFSTSRITNCYFLVARDGGGSDNGHGFPLTDEQMKEPSSFFGWDFIGRLDGPHDIWAEPNEGGYPILWWQLSPLPKSPFLSGKSESNDPYFISTADELNSIGHNPRFMAAHFKLINDIDLAGIEFFIIGSEIFPFSGVFDGNDHTIINFNHTTKYVSCVGLFGYVKGPKAEIRDLGLISPNINWASGDVGSLVGYFGDGTISNCYAEGGSVNGFGSVGGLVGLVNGSITNCYSNTTVSGMENVGGLVGSNGYTGTISNCYSTGSVSGDRTIGGLVGTNSFGLITNCYSAAGVEGKVNIGGLVGLNGYNGTISNCYSTGSASGERFVGGLVGANLYGHITNCYTTACVDGNEYVGGLVGENTSIPNQQGQYNTGIIVSSFWDMETSGQTTSDGGTGMTTVEMQTAKTFLDAGWDFVGETENGTEDIWSICEGTNYPRFVWQIPVGDFVCPDGITIDDFSFFMEHWLDDNCDLSNDYCEGTDLDQSGTVDVNDLEIFFENWTDKQLEKSCLTQSHIR